MMENRNEQLDSILQGEDSLLELKEVRFAGGKVTGPRQSDLADEIAAFANGHGGTIVLGVQDKPRAVVGIPYEHLDLVEELARNACCDSIKPLVAWTIRRMKLPDANGNEKPVILVQVPGTQRVHSSPSGYLHRIGSSKRQLTPEHLELLFRQRSHDRHSGFDESPVSEASLNVLDKSLCERFRTPRSLDDQSMLLTKLAMAMSDEHGVLRPTVAGILLGCERPDQYLPHAMIQAVAYKGTSISDLATSTYQRDARNIRGPLDAQIFEACNFVSKNMFNLARKNSTGGRVDLPQYDMLSVFEALTNAVAHRDYSMRGSKVRLRMFDNRLELYVPGMLCGSMTPESLPYRQSVRNDAIASLLARCPVRSGHLVSSHREHIMDRRGEGVPIILDRSTRQSGQAPTYRLYNNTELVLTIFGVDPNGR